MPNIKITCPRCAGSGQFSFHLTKGTVCFQCDGIGYLVVDQYEWEKKEVARKIREEKRQAEIAARVAVGQVKWEALKAKYKDDPRIGSKLRKEIEWQLENRDCEQLAMQTYKGLQDIDSGTYQYAEQWLDQIGKADEVILNVPFKDKDKVKAAGAKWNNSIKKWVWSKGELPDELKQYVE